MTTTLFSHPPRLGPIERRITFRSLRGDREHDTGWRPFQDAEILRDRYILHGWVVIDEESRFARED